MEYPDAMYHTMNRGRYTDSDYRYLITLLKKIYTLRYRYYHLQHHIHSFGKKNERRKSVEIDSHHAKKKSSERRAKQRLDPF
jgi:hypothetical protein